MRTVPQMGWAGVKNGQLLALAEQQFDVFQSVDQNLAFQQNLAQFKIGVVILCAVTNRLADLRPLAPKVLASFGTAKAGEALTMGPDPP